MIKAEFNVCHNYNACYVRRMAVNEINGYGEQCLECDLYRSYRLGFSDGVKQTVDAMTNVKPLLTQPFSRDDE